MKERRKHCYLAIASPFFTFYIKTKNPTMEIKHIITKKERIQIERRKSHFKYFLSEEEKLHCLERMLTPWDAVLRQLSAVDICEA